MLTRRTVIGAGASAGVQALLEPLRAAAAEARRVRITDIESFHVNVPPVGGGRDPDRIYAYPVTRIHTDAGVTGTDPTD